MASAAFVLHEDEEEPIKQVLTKGTFAVENGKRTARRQSAEELGAPDQYVVGVWSVRSQTQLT